MNTSPGDPMAPSVAPGTFGEALSRALRSSPARPLVTFYDDASGERVELSVTTYANWVAKTASLVQDELDLERGGLVLVDLPTHWLGAVWLGALWSGGQVVTASAALADRADLVVCGPEGTSTYADRAGDVPVVALSLRPLGARFNEPLPPGVVDYGAVVLGQPDVFVPLDPPDAADPAWQDEAAVRTQRDVMVEASRDDIVEPGGRLLTDVNPCTPSGVQTLLAPLVRAGSAVWVRNPNPDSGAWQRRYDEERATQLLRS